MALVRTKSEQETHVSAGLVRAAWMASQAAALARRVEN